MQWVIETVTIAPDSADRKLLQGHITWRGGIKSPIEIARSHDRRKEWDEREQEVLRLWYSTARWEDLERLLPGRKRNAIQIAACRMGIGGRPRHPMYWQAIHQEEMNRLAPKIRDCEISEVPVLAQGSCLSSEAILWIADSFSPHETR